MRELRARRRAGRAVDARGSSARARRSRRSATEHEAQLAATCPRGGTRSSTPRAERPSAASVLTALRERDARAQLHQQSAGGIERELIAMKAAAVSSERGDVRHEQSRRHRSRHHQQPRRLREGRRRRSSSATSSGDALVPSIVSVAADGTIYVGREAQRRLLTDAQRTVYSVKRFMGKGVDDVQRRSAAVSVSRRAATAGGVVRIGLGEREFTPPEISAFILRELKRRAEEFFAAARRDRSGSRSRGHHRAGVLQRRAAHRHTRCGTHRRPRGAAHHQRADGGVAGLRSRQAAHRHDRRLRFRRRHVRHLDPPRRGRRVPGAGDQRRHAPRRRRHRSAADAASHERTESVPLEPTRTATGRGFCRSVRLQPDPEAIQEIRKAVIQAKWDLSERDETELLGARLTRAEFEALIRPIIDRTLEPCRQALADAGLEPSQIDEVVLVGGSTRIPLVRRLVGELFGERRTAS